MSVPAATMPSILSTVPGGLNPAGGGVTGPRPRLSNFPSSSIAASGGTIREVNGNVVQDTNTTTVVNLRAMRDFMDRGDEDLTVNHIAFSDRKNRAMAESPNNLYRLKALPSMNAYLNAFSSDPQLQTAEDIMQIWNVAGHVNSVSPVDSHTRQRTKEMDVSLSVGGRCRLFNYWHNCVLDPHVRGDRVDYFCWFVLKRYRRGLGPQSQYTSSVERDMFSRGMMSFGSSSSSSGFGSGGDVMSSSKISFPGTYAVGNPGGGTISPFFGSGPSGYYSSSSSKSKSAKSASSSSSSSTSRLKPKPEALNSAITSFDFEDTKSFAEREPTGQLSTYFATGADADNARYYLMNAKKYGKKWLPDESERKHYLNPWMNRVFAFLDAKLSDGDEKNKKRFDDMYAAQKTLTEFLADVFFAQARREPFDENVPGEPVNKPVPAFLTAEQIAEAMKTSNPQPKMTIQNAVILINGAQNSVQHADWYDESWAAVYKARYAGPYVREAQRYAFASASEEQAATSRYLDASNNFGLGNKYLNDLAGRGVDKMPGFVHARLGLYDYAPELRKAGAPEPVAFVSPAASIPATAPTPSAVSSAASVSAAATAPTVQVPGSFTSTLGPAPSFLSTDDLESDSKTSMTVTGAPLSSKGMSSKDGAYLGEVFDTSPDTKMPYGSGNVIRVGREFMDRERELRRQQQRLLKSEPIQSEYYWQFVPIVTKTRDKPDRKHYMDTTTPGEATIGEAIFVGMIHAVHQHGTRFDSTVLRYVFPNGLNSQWQTMNSAMPAIDMMLAIA